ncbi:hypothetical protein IWQ61_007435 [Dispira simplex]|nr:hypothetical protein IWQ61_007435 [Dispira simplex]
MAAYHHHVTHQLNTVITLSLEAKEGPMLHSPLLGSPLINLKFSDWTKLANAISSLPQPLLPITLAQIPPITETILSPPTSLTATPAARNLAASLTTVHDATKSHDATLSHDARLRGYSSNVALQHSHLPPEESHQPTLLYLHNGASLRSTRLFFYPTPHPSPPFENPECPPPDPGDLCLPRLKKSMWWQKINRLPIPPQHRTLLWRLALNHVPFHPQNVTTCFCGSLETTAHLTGWLSHAYEPPNLDPHLWIALLLLEWPHIQDFDDPVVRPFCHTWALTASTLLYNIWMAHNDLAYQNNLWPTIRLVKSCNTTLKMLPIQTPKPSYPPSLNSALQPYLLDPSTGLPPLDDHHLRPP